MINKFVPAGQSARNRLDLARWAIGIILAFAIGCMAPAAFAARPMITDDARITDGKSCQLESWIRNNRHSTEYWAQPACNFTGNLELTMGSALTDGDTGTQSTDLVFQGKTVIRPLAANHWGSALTVGTVRHPQLGAGGSDWYVNVPVSYSFSDDRLVMHTNLGWLREQQTRHEHLTWGIGSETEITPQTWLIAEAFGQDAGKPFYQAGVRHWILPDRVQVDTTYGNRTDNPAGERWFSIGLRLLSVPFLQ